MANVVVVGTQWGDEGKGKLIDILAEFAKLVVRFQGGANAGHTLKVDGRELITHLVPSGVPGVPRKGASETGNQVNINSCVFGGSAPAGIVRDGRYGVDWLEFSFDVTTAN